LAKVSRKYQKQILLFSLIFVLPCVVLVGLSLRMIGQERELAQKRVLDERRRIAAEISQHLFNRLEAIKSREVRTPFGLEMAKNPDVVLLGSVENNTLKFPWELEPGENSEIESLALRNYVQRIQSAENEEIAHKNYARASQLYKQIIVTSETDTQKGYAQLLLARVLMKFGQVEEALTQYTAILALPSKISDELGIPIFLYAAGRLTDTKSALRDVADRIREDLFEERWKSPSESYMVQDICLKLLELVSDPAQKKIVEENLYAVQHIIENTEQALSVQRNFPGLFLNLQSEQQGMVWIAHGETPWVLSLSSPEVNSETLLIGVSVSSVLDSLRSDRELASLIPENVQFVSGGSEEGEYMGPNLRGMRMSFHEKIEDSFIKQWSLQLSFYLLALFLVIGVTLFGAYLLWRDIRRDLKLAEMRSQFVSSVSHELKTPLTSIRMFAETLRLGRSKDKNVQNEYLDTIVNESQRLTRLLNDVLDFSKIEKGKRIYKMESHSLRDIVQRAALAMEYQLSQQGFKLHVQTEEGIPEVNVDGDAIDQALLNLISNAMKYSGESRDIELKLFKEDNQVVFQVVDQGVGIDPQEQKRIFEKFYRVSTPENDRTAGTGLGLSLVAHIVEAHNGHLDVESTKGKGSVFSIYLPLKKDS